MPDIQSLRDVTLGEFRLHEKLLPETIQPIVRHVIEEIARTEKAVTLLERGDLHAFGKLMVESHNSLRNNYRVSLPELDCMVRIATSLNGCYGARLTGGGFGGSTVNLVDQNQAEQFIKSFIELYHKETGLKAIIHICKPSGGAGVEKIT